ncbi:glutathione S-transferase family protein [Rhizobium lentis]|uniref:Glutathione S-transferase family protein n=1 Tax=Rhizobium lentis TaxID=1138194 RepID=A0A9Q3QUP3_9HYPH|nr:glutathione S-transferase family protein [Rhizobium lentis]MBX4976136.1 glutathione S-transferase family protein [Rhizobium lentis]MBX5012765.1 glutathione S-transferase family protein [Rhizobium lentis]MBX5022506.1 glutathione S-transferase family protein [Rhizobium lentis]
MRKAAKLYYCETLNPRKACAAARFLQADVDFVRVDLASGEQRSAEFLALNPNGKVPVLQDDAGTLWEANAIMCRLSDAVAADFWPHDHRQIDVLRWLSWDASHFTLHGATLWFEILIKPLFGGKPDNAVIEDAKTSFRHHGRVLDDHLAANSVAVGKTLTVADFALAAALPYAAAAEIPLAEFRHIQKWYGRLEELDAWQNPFPA